MTTSPSQEDVKPRRGRRRQKEKNKQKQKRREKQDKNNRKLLLSSSSLPEVTQSPALDEYISVLKSPISRIKVRERLDQVFKALDIPGSSVEERAENFAKEARDNNHPQWLDSQMRRLVADFKKRVELEKDLKGITTKHYFSAIKNFCLINNIGITVNWLLLSKKLPAATSKANVRSPTPEEIRMLLKHAGRRLKVIVLFFCSSGIRVGAFPYLRKEHITPIYRWEFLVWKKRKLENQERFEEANKIVISEEDKHVIIAAKVITYPGEPEQRFTFISPEAHEALQDYLKFREKDGEKITDDSVIIRDEWETIADVKRGANRSMASNPKGIKSGSIERYLARVEKKEGFHQDLPLGVRRYKVKTAHGFRRFFETTALMAGMTKINVDYLMGHGLGISEHYLDMDEFTILDDYLKAVNFLTINNDYQTAALLQQQVSELAEKNEEQTYIIKGKLAEKEKEAEEIKKQFEDLKLQQELMRAEYEIDRANNRNVMDFLQRKTDKLSFHLPCYRVEDSQEKKAKEIIELGEFLRKRRESAQEQEGEAGNKLMTFKPVSLDSS